MSTETGAEFSKRTEAFYRLDAALDMLYAPGTTLEQARAILDACANVMHGVCIELGPLLTNPTVTDGIVSDQVLTALQVLAGIR